MAPSLDEWNMEINPGVYIPLIIIIPVIDIPLLVGILKSKASRRQISNIAIVNFIFVSFVAIGLMAGSTHYGLELYEEGKKSYNCDVIIMAFRILRIVAAVTLLTIVISKMIEILLVPYAKLLDQEQPNKMAPNVRNLFMVLCVTIPWIYGIVINVAIVNYSSTMNAHDCFINISSLDMQMTPRIGYFLSAAIAMVVCLLCFIFTAMLPRDVTKPSVIPHIIGVIAAYALQFPWFYFYVTKCESFPSYPGCYVSRENRRIYLQPAIIAYYFSFLMFPLLLFLSKSIRSSYSGAWAFMGDMCLRLRESNDETKKTKRKRKSTYVHRPTYATPITYTRNDVPVGYPWSSNQPLPIQWFPGRQY